MRARFEVVEDVPMVEVCVREDTVHATAHRTELRDRRFLINRIYLRPRRDEINGIEVDFSTKLNALFI